MKKHILRFRAGDKDEFEDIRVGRKTVETRAGTVKFKKIEVGDTLVIKCGSDTIEKTVKDIRHYKSVEDIYKSGDFGKVMPGIESLEEAEKVYYGFQGYREKIAEHGILAFYL
ncbi:MAG TPA: ASCH domain-containing protein [Candidatus Dormibacteraeota bacterium]|nr:ASCH domain-containing protein [Candidatus Dormibacteraeota bacterium]